ncbi:MAG: hypothetical protein BGO67_05385 [Alphaproteobacteria bacterium 41-28]|mgnify:CR=1 FL=1|nr:MAG: hypothetical protein BGO67_05385 [Alphaproteobacteria bacterium 41-28]
MTQNLLKRRKKLEQRKNRLKQMETTLNIQERKNRTRRLIQLGGLVLKAHLADWDSNTLFGALLFIKEKGADPQQLEAWTHKGGLRLVRRKQKNSLPFKFET